MLVSRGLIFGRIIFGGGLYSGFHGVLFTCRANPPQASVGLIFEGALTFRGELLHLEGILC